VKATHGWAQAELDPLRLRGAGFAGGPQVARLVLLLGRRAELATVVGNAEGPLCKWRWSPQESVLIVAESEPVFTAIKVAGAAYLIVLGVRVVRDRPQAAERPALGRRARMSSSMVNFIAIIVGRFDAMSLKSC
jgi:threonine/homoserine/homoserine lactone efflux protein